MAVCLATLFAVLAVWGNAAPGYFAGWGDHFVLSPEGIQWANPAAFKGDWFMANAPQPHWFFDIVTFLGSVLGHLSITYALFWFAGLLAFGFATAMLAKRWTPRAPWLAAVVMTVVTTQTPWMLVGTGTLAIPQALPAVAGADLTYLFVAALLTERRRLAATIATIAAIVHVQQGAVVVVILIAALLADSRRFRRISWPLLFGIVGSAFFVVVGLVARPVAANLEDFVRVCDEIIPYHCAAHTWSLPLVLSSVGVIALAGLTILFVDRRLRPMWLVSVGLAAVGLVSGLLADYWQIPILGNAAQGMNVYRLGAVILPFTVWGVLYPILKPAWNPRFAVILAGWSVSFWLFLINPGWFIPVTTSPLFLLIVVIAVGYTVLGNRYFRSSQSRSFITGTGAFILALLFVLSAALTNSLTIRSPDITFIQNATLRHWGDEVRKVVPTGEQLIASPRNEFVKLVTRRGVVADCKDVPYGGTAWRQWNQRLSDLGGVEQCMVSGPLLYEELSGNTLDQAATKYGTRFVVIDNAQRRTIEELESLGWGVKVAPEGGLTLVLLERAMS